MIIKMLVKIARSSLSLETAIVSLSLQALRSTAGAQARPKLPYASQELTFAMRISIIQQSVDRSQAYLISNSYFMN